MDRKERASMIAQHVYATSGYVALLRMRIIDSASNLTHIFATADTPEPYALAIDAHTVLVDQLIAAVYDSAREAMRHA